MTITKLARKVTLLEGRKRSVSIAQVMEIMRIINAVTRGNFYKLVRSI